MAEASPLHSIEKIVAELVSNGSPPHITINSESMQVDTTNVTVHKTKDPFKYFGLAIIDNIVDYSSSIDEYKEEEKKKKKEEIFAKESVGVVRVSIEAMTTSTPTFIVIVTSSTPPI